MYSADKETNLPSFSAPKLSYFYTGLVDRVYSLGFDMSRKSISLYLWIHLYLFGFFSDSPCPAHTPSVPGMLAIFALQSFKGSENSHLYSIICTSSYVRVKIIHKRQVLIEEARHCRGQTELLGSRDKICQHFLFQRL